ncbi:MAG: formimidoylglutamase [Bacteroidales bacterium]|nr:formimidoylglutamase [Bacteroidales bacterium]
MDVSTFFEPVDLQEFPIIGDNSAQTRLGNTIRIFSDERDFPDYSSYELALIGVKDDRSAINNEGCAFAPDMVRKYLYQLNTGPYPIKLVDLGNIRKGHALSDTYFAVSSVVAELLSNNVFPIIIGGSQDLTYANYQAYQSLGQIINIVAVDPMFDLGKSEQELTSQSYLSNIILHQPNYLFNYANIGYQTYFVDQEALKLMKNLFFDTYRLGIVRESLEEVEPIVRNADMLSFDISSVRISDAPGNGNATPNGFYGEEACQIIRYAGLSDKLTSIGFYEVNPSLDHAGQTSHLVAQMIWYFLDGFYNRAHDFPFRNEEDYLKYRVSIRDHKEEIVFFKSKKTDRWWMEIPLPMEQRIKYERHYLVPCSYKDYQTACENDIPDRWWMVYQKLM